MEKFHNKYRIGTTRLQSWDYSRNGIYFITICTIKRNHYFGEIKDGIMNLSQIGQFAHDCWMLIPDHFPFVELGAFVVIPDHLHGVLIINKPVKAQNLAPLQQPKTNKFGPQSKNLASVIRGYKIGVTKFARANNLEFRWQPRFHDHIIRDNEGYEIIKNYIYNNPTSWVEEPFFPGEFLELNNNKISS